MHDHKPQNTKWTGLEKKLLMTIIVKTLKTQNKERLLKTMRGKTQVTCKGKAIRITSDYSIETLKPEGLERRSLHF